MKAYLAGPMSFKPDDFNHPAFHAAAAELRALGHEVVNPAELDADTGKPWASYLRADLVALVACDAIALLPGWSHSKGARLEAFVAAELGMARILLPGAEGAP